MTTQKGKSKSRIAKSDKASAPKAPAKTKQAQVVALLRRRQGATIDEIATAIGWQNHSVRGAISGTLNKRLGLAITSENEKRGRVYRVTPAGQRASA